MQLKECSRGKTGFGSSVFGASISNVNIHLLPCSLSQTTSDLPAFHSGAEIKKPIVQLKKHLVPSFFLVVVSDE